MDELLPLSQIKRDVDQLKRQGSTAVAAFKKCDRVLFQAFISCMKVYKVGFGSASTAGAEVNKAFVVFHYDRFSLNRQPYIKKPFRPIIDPPKDGGVINIAEEDEDNGSVASELSQLVSYDQICSM